MLGSIRAQRGRARSALFYRVVIKNNLPPIQFDCSSFEGGVGSKVNYSNCEYAYQSYGVSTNGVFVAPENGTWLFTFSGTVAVCDDDDYVLGMVNIH